MDTQPIVFVVDGDEAVRKTVFGAAKRLGLVVRRFTSPGEALAFCSGEMPGCFVVNHRVCGTSGLQLCQQLTAQGCHQPFIYVSEAGDIASAVAAMRQGALDCIFKPIDSQQLFDDLQQAITQDANCRRQRAERATVLERFESLTPRERQVLDLVGAGFITRRIAGTLKISPKTVEVHRSHILRKLGLRSASQLLHLLARHSLAQLHE